MNNMPTNRPPARKKNRQKHILLAEDDKPLRRLLAYHIKQAGYTLTQASDGQEALVALARQVKNNTVVDLLLLDINMPILDGVEFLSEVRSHKITIPALVLTGGPTRENLLELKKLGIEGLVVKPVSPSEMIDQIKSVFQKIDIRQKQVMHKKKLEAQKLKKK